MSEAIPYEMLYVTGCFEAMTITKFLFIQKFNSHAYAYVRGIISLDKLVQEHEGKRFDEIQICVKGERAPIYCGVIKDYEVCKDGGSALISITAVSGSYLLDQEKRYCSFQKRVKYSDIIKKVLKGKGKAIYICDDKIVEMPMVQYYETDWEFIKRMASRMHAAIIPDINSVAAPRIYVGVRKGELKEVIETDCFKTRLECIGRHPVSYEVESYENYKVGDHTYFLDHELLIYGKKCNLKNGVLTFTYLLSSEAYGKTEQYHNRYLHGKEITGKVVEIYGEKIKINLETDVYGKEDIDFFYKWMPESGNLSYCMPEIGTRVTLYFGSDDEGSGICINCVRNASDNMMKDWNHKEKYFVTPWGKMMYLKPQKLKIGGVNSGMRVYDDQGIIFDTDKSITMHADGDIILEGGELFATAPKEIGIAQKHLLNPAMITMHDDFDAKGRIGNADGTSHYDDKEIPKQVMGGHK